METYTCEQLTAVINDPTTDEATRARAQMLFDAKCGGGGVDPQSGGVPIKHPPHP